MKTVAIVIICSATVLAQQRYATPTIDCVNVSAGSTQRQQTESRLAGKARAYARITISRPADDKGARNCRVAYALIVSEDGQSEKVVGSFEENGREAFGVDVIGFSPDASKVAANFWYAAGDFSSVRPAVYDRATRRALVKELGDQITSLFPSCAYLPEMTGVTNRGEAILHVPKSVFVETGCPDQGDWWFNPGTGSVQRATRAKNVLSPAADLVESGKNKARANPGLSSASLTVDRHVAAESSSLNKVQQRSTSGPQQVQQESLRNNKIQQIATRPFLWFGTSGVESCGNLLNLGVGNPAILLVRTSIEGC